VVTPVASLNGLGFQSATALECCAVSLTREDVEKVALLARLQLSPAEIETMTAQLGDILGYIDQLQELDVTNVEPMAHAIEMRNVFRDDIPAPSLPREQALANASDQDGEFYRVPAVLGE
jgi:aspartyl-tRNA(Asn)/glutamyl-tRNA(Gln) amidotransferase subunit C